MDQVVELERINLSRVQACKPIAHMLEKEPKLVIVVLADQLARRTATSSLAFDIADPHTIGYARNLPLRAARPRHRPTVATRLLVDRTSRSLRGAWLSGCG